MSLIDSNRQCSLSRQERKVSSKVHLFKYNSRKAGFFCYSSHFYLVYMQSGILFSPKEQIYDFFRKMDGIEDDLANQHKPDPLTQVAFDL